MTVDIELERGLDLSRLEAVSIDDLAHLAEVTDYWFAADERMRQAIKKSRGNGRNWVQIGTAMGITPDAAQLLFEALPVPGNGDRE